MKTKIKWLALLGWMLVIFLFSAQTGEQSSESSGLIEQLLSLFPFIPHQIFGIDLQLIIRKGAHFTEYLILYVLTFIVFIDYQTFKKSLVYAIIFVFLYACTDEIHQAFVPGRACAFTDVMIDTAGGLLALFFIMITNEIQRQTTKKA
ncbi:MAG: VanZ family protein [Turicibacter sp.]|nr:VanZ family protein [Turicibacter sp.]MDO5792794.1 VanZ family protein [Turicibacter sp.]